MKCLIIILVLATSLITTSFANDLKVATEEFPPLNYSENGKIKGISTEVVEAVLARAGITAGIEIYPWARCYRMVLEQPNVMAFSMGRTPEREDLFIWIGPIAPPIKTAFFKLKQRGDILLTSLVEAKKYKIGVVRDSGGHKVLLAEGFEDEANLFPVSTIEQNLKKLFSGRIDFLFYNNMTVLTKTKELGQPPSQLEEALVFGQFETYMALNKNTDKATVTKMRTAFEQIRSDGIIRDIEKKYLNLLY